MTILGLTGPIGHGKSTFAKAISALEPAVAHFESSLIVGEVADALHAATIKLPSRDDIDKINEWLSPLPDILLKTVNAHCIFNAIALDPAEIERHPVEYEKLFIHIDNLKRNPTLLKQKITLENKESYRPILQWLGGYLVRRVDNGIWYKEIVRRIQQLDPNQFKICIVGGLRFPNDAYLLKKAGGTIIKVYRPEHLQYDKLDPTERERDNIPIDCTVVSNGTIDDLNNCAKTVLADINAGKIQPVYYAVQSQNAA